MAGEPEKSDYNNDKTSIPEDDGKAQIVEAPKGTVVQKLTSSDLIDGKDKPDQDVQLLWIRPGTGVPSPKDDNFIPEILFEKLAPRNIADDNYTPEILFERVEKPRTEEDDNFEPEVLFVRTNNTSSAERTEGNEEGDIEVLAVIDRPQSDDDEDLLDNPLQPRDPMIQFSYPYNLLNR